MVIEREARRLALPRGATAGARRPASPSTRRIAAASAGTSYGSTSSAASPATSGSDPMVLVTTGVPSCIASSTGRPNPS